MTLPRLYEIRSRLAIDNRASGIGLSLNELREIADKQKQYLDAWGFECTALQAVNLMIAEIENK